ncbi:MAG: hypothetical protein PUP92_38755 [Rhizonema sp. PD38]|nr:hypothetical protein [Rhizonema sp. PD38]
MAAKQVRLRFEAELAQAVGYLPIWLILTLASKFKKCYSSSATR